MISVVDLGIGAHEPDAGVIAVSFCSIAVIPLAVKLYQKPEVDLAVKLRVTVNTHVLDSCDVQKHFAAGIVNIAVTAVLRKSSVCRMFIIARTPEESEGKVIVNPVEDRSCGLYFVISVKAGHNFSGDSVRIAVTYVICSRIAA